MASEPDFFDAKSIAAIVGGSVVAAAGCGKTEQIARAISIDSGRRLVLTHTHAGVDALRERLRAYKVPQSRYRLETIAGWCLRSASAFPKRSGLSVEKPKSNGDWQQVYRATKQLIVSGAVHRMLKSTYAGVYVDEYQDCNADQHAVVVALSQVLPICVLGDPLQAIFNFGDQRTIEWSADVQGHFPQAHGLTTPWRWLNENNIEMAKWLHRVRRALAVGESIDLTKGPRSVRWVRLPDEPGAQRAIVAKECQSAMSLEGNLVVIADKANLTRRASMAQNLAQLGFSNIEPIDCKPLNRAAQRIGAAADGERLSATIEFIAQCMTGASAARFLQAVQAHREGRRLGRAQFGEMIDIGVAVDGPDGQLEILNLINAFQSLRTTHVYRHQMLFSMKTALRNWSRNINLADVVWEVQNKARHAGRITSRRSVGSTLLVKGLQFDHAIIIAALDVAATDWYVALTRATKTIIILTPDFVVRPAINGQ